MRNRDRKFSALVALVMGAALILAGSALAQDATLAAPTPAASPRGTAESQESQAFGLNQQDFWVSATQFAPRDGILWTYQTLLYFATPTSAQFEAQVQLPAGGLVTIVECFYYDVTANDASVFFVKQSYNYLTDTPSNSIITTVASSGTSGYQRPFQNVSATIRYREGDLRNIYTLVANMPGDVGVRLRGCRLFWNQQVSPAPATATFPNDVPTSHPFFRFVEALAASGVTAGCGAGSFCPDAPITRGQMAVFLSAALGLHWPY